MDNIKRLNRDDPDSYLVMIMYREARKHPKDGQWRRFDGDLSFCGRQYHMSAEFVLRDDFFTYKNLEVTALDRDTILLN